MMSLERAVARLEAVGWADPDPDAWCEWGPHDQEALEAVLLAVKRDLLNPPAPPPDGER